MEKSVLLGKLEELFEIEEVNKGFPSHDACLAWANKIVVLLKFVDYQYYVDALQAAHLLNNPNLTSFTVIPAFNTIKSQIQMAIADLKLRIQIEGELQEQVYFPEGSERSPFELDSGIRENGAQAHGGDGHGTTDVDG